MGVGMGVGVKQSGWGKVGMSGRISPHLQAPLDPCHVSLPLILCRGIGSLVARPTARSWVGHGIGAAVPAANVGVYTCTCTHAGAGVARPSVASPLTLLGIVVIVIVVTVCATAPTTLIA